MFYERIKKICSDKNVKITHLLTDLELSTGNLAKWKKGSVPKSATLEKIADYLGVSTDELMGRDTVGYICELTLPDGEVVTIHRTKKDPLTQEQREEIIAVLNSSEGIIRPYDKPEGESLDEYVRRIAREELDKHGKD